MGSDHKPVKCMFSVNIAHVDESTRRQEFGEITLSNEKVRRLIKGFASVPETTISSNNVILKGKDINLFRIANKCERGIAVFHIFFESQASVKQSAQVSEFCSTDLFCFPSWLEVSLPYAVAILFIPMFVIFYSTYFSDCICYHHMDIRNG